MCRECSRSHISVCFGIVCLLVSGGANTAILQLHTFLLDESYKGLENSNGSLLGCERSQGPYCSIGEGSGAQS